MPVQYVKWLANVLQGDFGRSFSRAQQPVFEVIAQALPVTVTIAALTLVANFTFGIVIGIISAVRQNSFLDRFLTVTALFFYSMPEFWFALMMIIVFALKLQWLPASGLNEIGAESFGPFGFCRPDMASRAAGNGAEHQRCGRHCPLCKGKHARGDPAGLLRTARAKGLPENVVISFRHALRNALLPVITLMGSLPLLFIFSGALFIEVIFAFPGMGRVTVEAIFARDYPLIIANTFISGTLIVLGNLLADVLYAVADPSDKTVTDTRKNITKAAFL